MVEHHIEFGLIVDCIKLSGPWSDHAWMPHQVLEGAPDTPPWTPLSQAGDRTRYFAGAFTLTLYSSDTAFYRDNLSSSRPSIWVVMQPEGSKPPLTIIAVTADPTEGEGYSQTGTNVVEVVDMPNGIAAEIAAFVAQHHVEQAFEKRKRDPGKPRKMGSRGPGDGAKP